MELALQLVGFVKIYGMIGAGIAVPFLVFGIDRIDPSSHGSFAFRPILLPGVIVIWPLVVWRWAHFEMNES